MQSNELAKSERNQITPEAYQLSLQQKFQCRLQKRTRLPNAQVGIFLPHLTQECLSAALETVCARHEVLRTTYPRLPGMAIPVQVIASQAEAEWRYLDLRNMDPDAQKVQAAQIAQQEREALIDIEFSSLVRLILMELDTDSQLLLITLPALSMDRRSLLNLATEIAAACSPHALPLSEEPPLQYLQYMEWQEDLQQSLEENAAAGRNYWQTKTQELKVVGALPFTRSPLDSRVFHPDVIKRMLEGESLQTLDKAAAEAQVSTSVFLETVWGILLARLTGETTFTLGHEGDGRTYPVLQSSLGVLAKTLPILLRMEPSTPFSLVLRETNAILSDASGWEEYYVPEADSIPPYRFDFELLTGLALPDGFALYNLCSVGETFHLGLGCRRTDKNLGLEFWFDPQHLSQTDVHHIADMYDTLLHNALAHPQTLIGALEIVPNAERMKLTLDWNRTQREYPSFEPVHRLFEAAAHAFPQATALVFGEQQMSYAQLNTRANRLARYLRKRGAGPDVVIGLCLERSLELVVSLLGILKAGAAYLPLDPALPRERLAGMLADSAAPLCVTNAEILERLGTSLEAVVVDQEALEIAQESDADLDCMVCGEHLVYVIYTSGSTGRPKGVSIEHRNLLNYVRGVTERLNLPESASYATVSTFAADLGHTAVFPALCSGGCLHVVPQEVAMDSQRWQDYFGKHAIDCLKIVPSHLNALLSDLKNISGSLPRCRLVLGGESSHWELVSRITKSVPDLRVFNHYGPTETTVGVLTYPVQPEVHSTVASTVPIGRPLPNSRVYLLNAYLQPVPIGVAGELYIGGASVGRGYLNQPELTAERFLHDPFSPDTEARMYRTGDLCRYLEDGNIEFLGRVDHQVKIRGFRIELGEIETVLRQHPDVQEAVVLAREDLPGDRQLVAYVVTDTGALNIPQVRDYLREKLPEFMLPRVIIPLNRMPLTTNGKIDRAALSAPSSVESSSSYAAPENEVQKALVTIWSKLLQRDRISITDNFFDIGGHSLLALQVVSRVRERLQVELPLRALFDAPTIVGLAERILAEGKTDAPVRPPVVAGTLEERIPLSFAQQRLWFVDQLDPGTYLYNVPATVRLQGTLNIGALQRALEEVVRRHEVLRTTFPSVNGTPVQVIAPTVELDLRLLDLNELPLQNREEEAQRLATEEAQRPFDLTQGPLFRATLLRLTSDEHWLIVVMHHIVTDGWSRGVFFQEISTLYTDFSAERASSLPDLPLQYADYAVWQRNWLKGVVLEEHLAYWRQQLAGAPPSLDLPTDRPRADILNPEGAWEYFTIPQSTAEKLIELGHQEGATLFMTLLAAFNVFLYRYTRSNDISVGTDVANRNATEIESLIGFFLNHIVLRTDLSGSPTFRELLGRVRKMSTEAFAHQELPFDKLVETLNPERRGNHTPLFQVLFVLQNIPRNRIELPGLAMSTLKMQHEVSKYDLSLFLSERSDGIAGAFLYKRDLFNGSTVASMRKRFEMLLESIVAQPDGMIHTLKIVSEAEKEEMQAEKRDLRNSKRAMLQTSTRQNVN